MLKNTKAIDMIYSFILYFRGGTYIERVSAPDVLTATHVWAKTIAHGGYVEHLEQEAFLKAFYYRIEVFQPNEINDCPNVWHFYVPMGRHKLDIHIVKTSTKPEPAQPASPLVPASRHIGAAD